MSAAAASTTTDLVMLSIDDVQVSVPAGTLVIRAAEQIGIQIPRFCDHPGLAPAGACRQCLVEVATPGPDGALRPMPKPQASCTLEVSPGMVVRTQQTSPVADKAQRGVMELLLINHPLDCPVCDKGGECPLQNQAMSNGRGESRFTEHKRTFVKPLRISTEVLLDRERCILCQRCTRFSDEVAGDPFIDLQMRGANQQVGTFDSTVLGFTGGAHDDQPAVVVTEAVTAVSGHPFSSYFSGNTVQICPVGALTAASYRFRARPFDLVSTSSTCEHCASGCGLRVEQRRGEVVRRLAEPDPAVNGEWNCDKGRWAFTWSTQADRLKHPLVRDEHTGELRVASWPEALTVAARGLAQHRDAGVGILTGGRITMEDAYAYRRFATDVLGGADLDFRARPHSAEELGFLRHHVLGKQMAVTYSDLDHATDVVLLGCEPEEESPIVFLRLRRAVANGAQVRSVAAWASRGLEKLSGTVVPCVPGAEPAAIDALEGVTTDSVVVVGERLAAIPGALSAVSRLAQRSGAKLAWIPRRAGERGALEAGAFPELGDRDASQILTAAISGSVAALVVGGVDIRDFADPQLVQDAVRQAAFVVSLEVCGSAITQDADVVLPVAPAAEKAGTFLTWEGRPRPVAPALPGTARSDYQVLQMLADEMGVNFGWPDVKAVHAEVSKLTWPSFDSSLWHVPAAALPVVGPQQAVLATWKTLLDTGVLQDGEAYLAGTAHPAVARMSAVTAVGVGVAQGDQVVVSTEQGSIRLPVAITEMPDNVVWLPTNTVSSQVHMELKVDAGAVVQLAAAPATDAVVLESDVKAGV